MRYLLRLVWLVLGLLPKALTAQPLDPSYYGYPLADVAGYLSANFGEMRSNHFHSGIDFKTDGREGKPVLAVADGYVVRIVLSPTGYGRALYVAHPNGTTSVYGHLQRFREDIEAWIGQERLACRQNRLDLTCDSLRFRVVKGEEIARSGNSGTSFGPHLHFEIRSTATQRTINPLSQGLYRPKDQTPPLLFSLHYVALDTLQGVPCHGPLRTFELETVSKGHYRLKQSEPLKVDRVGYFVLEASDRKEEVQNTFGLHRLEGYLDGELLFDYCMEGFTFDHSRYCNAVSYYPLQRTSRREVLRMAKLEGAPSSLYAALRNGGVVGLPEGARGRVRIVATDDCGNRSELNFEIEGCREEQRFRGRVGRLSPIIYSEELFRHQEEGVRVSILPGTLYENTPYEQAFSSRRISENSSVEILSPLYRILDESIPLQRSMKLSIEALVPNELRPHVALAQLNSRGKLISAGGRWSKGRVEGSASTAGHYCVVADRVAPRVQPLFSLDRRVGSRLRFRLSDNFSGIHRWSAYLDGRWAPLDYQPVRGTAILSLDSLRPESGPHRVVIRVEDGCGNITTWEGKVDF